MTWPTEEGGLSGTIVAIAQTTDGYLWVGTDVGLFRFDGSRFTPWTHWPKGTPLQPGIIALFGDREGMLWVASQCCVAHLENGEMVALPKQAGRANAFIEDRDGIVWFAQTRTKGGPLCSIDRLKTGVQCYGTSQGVRCVTGQTIATDTQGVIWAGSNPGVCTWDHGATSYYAPTGAAAETYNAPAASSLVSYGAGKVLVGYPVVGDHYGLQLLTSGDQMKSFDIPGLKGNELGIQSLMLDSKEDLWIGTLQQGLYHVSHGKADHFGASDGLSGDDVTALYEDREGSVWVASSSGISRLHQPTVVSISSKEGMISNNVFAVATKSDGSVAVGGKSGLQIMNHDNNTVLRFGTDLRGNAVHVLFYDHKGTLWVATDQQVGTITSGHFIPIPSPGLDDSTLISLTEDPQHHMWASSSKKVYKIGPFGLVEIDLNEDTSYSLAPDPKVGFWTLTETGSLEHVMDGVPQLVYHSQRKNRLFFGFRVEPNGDIWAWGPHGLQYWTGAIWIPLASKEGLPCDDVFTTVDDVDGNMWVSQPCGVTVVPYTQLSAWSRHKSVGIVPKFTVARSEGALGGFNDFRTQSANTSDGRLFFANDTLLRTIDTKHLVFNTIPPPVHIEELVADHQQIKLAQPALLPALTRDLQIDYTALSLVAPQKVRFRYRLTGIDKEWQDAGTRRQAFYMNLRPGTYQFQVVACNNNGVWNLIGDTIRFKIAPAYYQTAWFRLLCILLFSAAIWMLFLYRLNILGSRIQDRLTSRYQERLHIARDLHDTLLQGVYGLTLGFQVVMQKVSGNDEAKRKLDEMLVTADATLVEARQRLQSLRTEVESADLAASFTQVAKDLSPLTSTRFEATVTGISVPLNAVVREEIYSIGKEALTNAFRHACAEHIRLSINFGLKDLRICVCDDGLGIESAPLDSHAGGGHLGITGMMERAKLIGGRLSVGPNKPQGTKVDLWIASSVAYEPNSTRSFWKPLSFLKRHPSHEKAQG